MKRKRALLWTLVVGLLVLGIGLAVHKVRAYQVPFFPNATIVTWTVEAMVRFEAKGGEVEVELGLPSLNEKQIARQEVASLGYGYQEKTREEQFRRGIWSARDRKGGQRLFYQVTLTERDLNSLNVREGEGETVKESRLGGEDSEILARETLWQYCRDRSAGPESFVNEVYNLLFKEGERQEARFLSRSYRDRLGEGWEARLLGDFMQMEGIAYRKAWGLVLNEELGSQRPVPLLEYYDGRRWMSIEAVAEREPGFLVVWSRGDSLLDLRGGQNSQVYFTASKNQAPIAALERLADAPLWASSIAALPVNERRVFRYIALIPIGVLVIVFLRNFVGLNMLGTFMPVLLALSFLEIPLIPALIMFSALLGAGLIFRFFLSRLNLLVVPRVAACVVVVSLLMIIFGLSSWRLGLTLGLQVTVFPMVVLAWSIERMSLLWDEDGPKAALSQAGGSLLAAMLAYFVMNIMVVSYWAQYFPELLFVILAVIILIGRYTGYRVAELVRFRKFASL